MKIQLSLLFIFLTVVLFAQEERIILRGKQMSSTTIDEKQLEFLISHQEALKEFVPPKTIGMLEIPVKVHIVRSSQDPNPLSIDEIKKAFAQLNKYFINIYVQFVPLGDYNYIRNDKFFHFNKEDEHFLCNTNDVDKVLNLYITGSIEEGPLKFCGYTYYPQDLEKNIDRVFLDKNCLNDGVSLARQMGHYFTLFATSGLHSSETKEWVNGQNCSTEGDLICDTPADPGLTLSTVDDRCGYIGRKQDQSGRKRFYKPDTKNLMSDNPRLYCCNHFTPQQYHKMLYAAINLRKYLTFPKSQYSKRQLKILAEEKGLQGEVAVYVQAEEMQTKRNQNIYINQTRKYAPNAPYNIAITNYQKGYVYVLDGDTERGIKLLYPQKGDKVFFKGEEKTQFNVPSDGKLKIDDQKGKDGKNHIVVFFSKKQLRIHELITEMNAIDQDLNIIQKVYMTLGYNIIPSKNLTYHKNGIKVQGIATDQQIMPVIIEYEQL